MGWEIRGAQRYFYRTTRVPGVRHPVKQYLGRGRAAEIAASLHAEHIERREAERRALRVAYDSIQAHVRSLEKLDRVVRMLTCSALLVAGYYENLRSWRRRGTTRMRS